MSTGSEIQVRALGRTGDRSEFEVAAIEPGVEFRFILSITATLLATWQVDEHEEVGVAGRLAEPLLQKASPLRPLHRYVFDSYNAAPSAERTI